MAFDRMVGEAYILMRADGRLLPRDIKKAGQAAGAEYSKQFDDELAQFEQQRLTRFRRALAQSTADLDFSRFQKEFGSVEDTVDAIRKKLKFLRREGALSFPAARRVKEDLTEWAQSAIEARREQEKLNVVVADFGKVYRQGVEGMWRRYANDLASAVRSGDFSKMRFQGEQVNSMLTRMRRELDESRRSLGLSSEQIDDINAKLKTWAERQVELDRVSGKDVDYHSRASQITKAFDRIEDRTERVNLVFAKTFGKGSRNNFLNFVGTVVGGLTSLVTTLPLQVVKGITHIGDAFSSAFSASRAAGVGRFASAGKGLLGIFSKSGGLAGALISVVVALGAFGIALPAVFGLVSGLVGAVTALVGSIGIGLVGALFALTPVLAAAAGGFLAMGGAMAMFFSDKKNEKFIKGLTKEFKDFSKELYPQFREFFTFVASGFDTMLDDITPGLNTFLDSFEKRLGDATSQKQLSAWSDSMGRIFQSLSDASTAFIDGLVAFFVPILPYAERLADAVERGAERFSAWASSAGGQNSIADFMDKAWKAGKQVWEILTTIGSIFGTVFMAGNDTGTGFLENILTKLRDIDTFLESVEGQKALDDWFANAKEIGEGVGNLAIQVGKVIDYLDSPAGRENAQKIMDAMVGIGEAAVSVASTADAIGRLVGWMLKPGIVQALEAAAALFGKTTGKPREQPFSDPVKSGQAILDAGTSNIAPDIEKALTGKSGKSTKELVKEYLVKVKVDDLLYEEKRRVIEGYVFRDKTVPVKGNEALWNQVKGTVAGYAFDTKTVTIAANAKPVQSAIEKVKQWLASLPSDKVIRIAGINSVGGTTMASGGVVNKATFGVWGEAGAEALVPLDRPLSQVDPSVRALSAIAQGMNLPKAASGGIYGGGGGGVGAPVVLEQGAVQVITAAQSPTVVAKVVNDTIADAINGALV